MKRSNFVKNIHLMNRLRIIFLLVLLFPVLHGFTQTTITPPASVITGKNSLQTRLSLGSQFSSFGNYGSSFSSYVLPELSYNLTKRLSISGGIGYINTNYSSFRPDLFSEDKISTNMSTGLVYITGRYLLNEKLTVSGSAYKTFDLTGYPAKYPWMSNESKGVNMSVEYKVTDAFHIQAGFHYREGANPYYNDSPFYQDPLWGYPIR